MSRILVLAGDHREGEEIAREHGLGRHDWAWLGNPDRQLRGTLRPTVLACSCWRWRGTRRPSDVQEILFYLARTEAVVTNFECERTVHGRSDTTESDDPSTGVSLAPGFDGTPNAERDILAAIDDAVESRCACGCGAKLDPDGPSQWYATQTCQQRFLERQTTNPHEVRNRPDAAMVLVGMDSAPIPLDDPGDRMHWLRRRYLEAPPSAHAPRPVEPDLDHVHVTLNNSAGRFAPRLQMGEGTRVWIGDREVTEHVRSIDLNPMVEDTSFADSNWREVIGGLRSTSMSLNGLFEWSASEGDTSRHSEDDWAAVNPAAQSPSLQDDLDLLRSPETGRILDEWMARQMAETTPQPRLFGGEVGNLLGMPVIESPLVPEGEVYLVNRPQPSPVWSESEPMRFDSETIRWRIHAQMMAPIRPGDLLLFGDNRYYCREHVPNLRIRFRGAGWTNPRNNPRITALHRDYRHRSLARRRRNR